MNVGVLRKDLSVQQSRIMTPGIMTSYDNVNSLKPEAIELKLPAKTEYMKVVRMSIAGISERMHFSVDDIEDIKIAVCEACINSIRHGYQEKVSEENLIYARFIIHPKKLEIIITDSGKGFDTSRVDEYLAKPGDEKVEGIGLGIQLMKTLMNGVKYSSSANGTKVRLVKNE